MAASTISSSIHHGQCCVAGGPGGVSCGNSQHTAGISIHIFPNRKKDSRWFRLWVLFVRQHRPNWSPTSDKAILCSIHFEESCFHLRRDIASSLGIQARLTKTAVPTIDAANKSPDDNESLGLRERRKVSRPKLPMLLTQFRFVLLAGIKSRYVTALKFISFLQSIRGGSKKEQWDGNLDVIYKASQIHYSGILYPKFFCTGALASPPKSFTVIYFLIHTLDSPQCYSRGRNSAH